MLPDLKRKYMSQDGGTVREVPGSVTRWRWEEGLWVIAFTVVSAGKTGEAGEARLDNFSGLWGTGAVPDGCHWPWGDASRYMVARV